MQIRTAGRAKYWPAMVIPRPAMVIPAVVVPWFVLMVAVLTGGTAAAGGWAVSSLDPIPTSPVVGRAVAIGFTIRQHGVTPVAIEDVAITIAGVEGARTTFPARADGPVGHYIADVRFPNPGKWTWEVEQGLFGPQKLGSITIRDAASSGAHPSGSTRPRGSLSIRLLSVAATVATAVATVAMGLRSRRETRSLRSAQTA